MGLNIGDIIQNKYRIVKMIGEGGMGAVYEGENTLIARRVAIKVLHNSAAVNPDIVQRFQREAQAAGRIGNDHILDVLDLGNLADGDLFMVMEFLDGENLADRIDRQGRMTPAELYPIARQLLEGLKAAHDAGIIHRDLKPENVFILKEKAGNPDFVKIIDFGISKFNVLDGNMQMTATGAVMGTPYYMAPEQAKGSKGADPRSDVYAIGVILYKAITGDEPFSAETFNELLFKIVLADLVPARQLVPELDEAFDSIISKAMAKDPEHRFATCDALIEALDNWARSGASVTVPPPPHTNDPAVLAGVAPDPRAQQASSPALGTGEALFAPSDSGANLAGVPAGVQIPGQTPGSWAQQSGIDVPRKSAAGLIAALGVVALVVLVGGAFGIYKLVSSGDGASEAAEAAADGAPSAEEATPAESDEAQPDVTPAEKPTSEPEAIAEASDTEEQSETGAAAAEDAGATTGESAGKASSSHRPTPTRTPRPRARPTRTPRPTETPTSGSPDFGY
jgi:serine/threonine protein kinase